jgi:hypothetical protein
MVYFYSDQDKYQTMMTFTEYLQFREGLWLNDKKALLGLSRLDSIPKRPKPKPLQFKPFVPKIRPAVPKIK